MNIALGIIIILAVYVGLAAVLAHSIRPKAPRTLSVALAEATAPVKAPRVRKPRVHRPLNLNAVMFWWWVRQITFYTAVAIFTTPICAALIFALFVIEGKFSPRKYRERRWLASRCSKLSDVLRE